MFGAIRKIFSKAALELSEEQILQLEKDPWNLDVVRELSRAFRRDQRPLIDYLRKRATADPHNYLVALGRVYVAADKPTLAILQYRKYLQTPEGAHHPAAREELASIYEKLGKPEDAKRARAGR